MNRNGIGISIFGILSVLAASAAWGGTIDLLDQNSSAAITTSNSGLTNWTVNGQNIAVQQSFWYAIDGGQQASVDTLNLTGSGTYYYTGTSGTRGAYLTYSGTNGFGVEIDYFLTGGSSNGQSNLGETIRLTNNNGTSHTFHLYDYSNFKLATTGGDKDWFENANTVDQVGGTLPMQTTVTPTPNFREAAVYPQTLNELNGATAYTLNNSPSTGTQIGPGDVTWAYQWDALLSPGASFIINANQHVDPGTPVPEPWTSAMLFAAGVSLMGMRWWRRVAV